MSDNLTPTDIEVGNISIFDICETDPKAEEEGRWFRDIFNDGTNIDVKMRYLSSRASLQVRRRLDKGFRKHMKNGQYSDDMAIKILLLQMSEAVILDWKGINDHTGKPIPFSKEAAHMLLTRLTVFRNVCLTLCNSLESFRIEEATEVSGN